MLSLSPSRAGCIAEIELYTRLPRCQHLVAFYEAFWESPGQTLLLVLEYGDAGDLEAYIQSRRDSESLTEQEAMRIFVQVH